MHYYRYSTYGQYNTHAVAFYVTFEEEASLTVRTGVINGNGPRSVYTGGRQGDGLVTMQKIS